MYIFLAEIIEFVTLKELLSASGFGGKDFML